MRWLITLVAIVVLGGCTTPPRPRLTISPIPPGPGVLPAYPDRDTIGA